MRQLGCSAGDIGQLSARAPVKLMPSLPHQRGTGVIALDATTRHNAGVSIGQMVDITPIRAGDAANVTLFSTSGRKLRAAEQESIATSMDGMPISRGCRMRFHLVTGPVDLEIQHCLPLSPATLLVCTSTIITFTTEAEPARRPTSFSEIGGLDRELSKLREIVELPLLNPGLFQRLGVLPPKGVLLFGPPGSGKTLMAKAMAAEANARFFYLSAPEVMRKHYGESEARLREVFDKARAAAPSILFIDEIDAIAPRRDLAVGEVEKRVVAQLLTLMDGMDARGNVIVVAATNLPNSIDPALRRPGRFDREVSLGVPNKQARCEILRIHARDMPLSDGVDLDGVANRANGFTGADLRALCQEAGLAAASRLLADHPEGSPVDAIVAMVEVGDFEHALANVTPSAMREVAIEVPDTRWEDIGGLDEVKEVLQETIVLPLLEPELFLSMGINPPRGVLLHGPPGTGKTLLARAIASEAGANFINIRGPELLSKFVGDSERAVRELFQRARMAAPCVLFFDEIDALAPRRGSGTDTGNSVTDRVVAQLLTELDGVRPLSGVSLLAATNRLDVLDEALIRPGRIDLVLEVPLPTQQQRASILGVLARGRPLHSDVDIDEIAARADGFSGADLAVIFQRAAMRCMRRRKAVPADGLRLLREDFEAAIEAICLSRKRP